MSGAIGCDNDDVMVYLLYPVEIATYDISGFK